MGHSSRFLGPESQGSRPALESWRPATDKEAASYVQGCVTRLAEFATRDDELGVIAREGLGRNLRGLAGSGFIDVLEMVVRQVGATTGYWPEALESLGHFLRYDVGRTVRDTANRVRTLIAELTPQSLESRVRFLVTEMPWDYPCDEDLDFEARDRRRVEAVRALAAELVQQPALLNGVLPQLSRGGQRMTYAFGVAVADLADPPLNWLEPIILAVVETPESERSYELLSGYVTGIAEDCPDIVEALKRKAAQSPELAPGLPLICWRLGITSSDIGLIINALQAGLLPPPTLMQWTSGGVLAKVPAPSVAPLIDVMLDHGAEAFAVAMGLTESCARGVRGKIAGFRPQIRKSVENFTRWKQLRKQQGAAADFELIVHWMLEQGREDVDARATALALAKALVNVEGHGGEPFLKPVIPKLLSGFPEIAWPLIGQAIVSDQQRARRLAHVLRGRRPADGESNPIILSLPEDTLFAWCHAHPDRAPAFAAGVVPVLVGSELEASERSLHPVMIRLLDEFGDCEGVLRAVLANMHTFSWWGSLASRFALYEEPLRSLRSHPKPKVRRWATATLRGLAATIENVHDEEEERKARWEPEDTARVSSQGPFAVCAEEAGRGRIDVQRTGAFPFRGGTGEIERPPRPAGRGGQGSSRCPGCGADRGPGCHVPLPARRDHHVNITVNYDGGQVAKPRVASVAARTILPRGAADRGARTMLGLLYEVGSAFPEMSWKGMNGAIAPPRWIRLGQDLCAISVRNRDRSALRPAPQEGNGSLMRVHAQGRHQIDRLAAV